jgi:flagellar hook-length control protein FliK
MHRLPANKELRIQLRPDDLGGVQVVLRYSASGGVELHIAVERAATGTLVQAGWTELREALATQGISPDRLIMSVTAGGGAGQAADFAGSSRQDSGSPASFNQNTSSQMSQGGQGQARQEHSGPRGWTGASASGASAPEGGEPVVATMAPTRIDYRV